MGKLKRRRAVGAQARSRRDGQESVKLVIKMPRVMADESLELLRFANAERKKLGDVARARGEDAKSFEPLDWNTFLVFGLLKNAMVLCVQARNEYEKSLHLVQLADHVPPPPPAGKPLPKRLIVLNG